jgi:AcrR family transcriptional regulator
VGAPANIPKADGRAERSAGTRLAVAGAYLELVDGGDLRPTARAIAARAGVSERAVFRHFRDMETLLAEAARLQIRRLAPAMPPPAPNDGPLAERSAALARRWSTLHEWVTPVRRVAHLHEPFSEEVARRLAWIRGLASTETEMAFQSELGPLPQDERRVVVAALSAALSWETWHEFRTRRGLPEEVARATLIRMLEAILGGMGTSK